MLFPVGLEPISISTNKEIYHWEQASFTAYNTYLEKIPGGLNNWKKESMNGAATTFVSGSGNVRVTITLIGKQLIYDFIYLEDE